MKTIFAKQQDLFDLVVKLSPDKMKLFVDIEPKGNVDVERDRLWSLLIEAAPNAPLNEDVVIDILRCLKRGEKVAERRIAKGKPVEPGADGKVLLLVKDFKGQGQAQVDEKGYAKFSELHLFDNIEKGQQVARVYEPKAGADGYDALGEKIIAPIGKPARLTLDASAKLQPGPKGDYQVVVAETYGYLKYESGNLKICEELVVPGNLDLHYGSINFIGSVRIQGDVGPGLFVRGRTGIEIGGEVREASISSSEGSVVIKGFAFGGASGKISAGKEFRGTVVHQLEVEAREDIWIEREAADARLRTQKLLRAGGGRITGGELFIVAGGEVKTLGNPAGVKTGVKLCSDIEATAEYTELLGKLARHESALELLKLHLGPFASNPTKVKLLAPQYKKKIEELLKKRDDIERSKALLLERQRGLLGSAKAAEGVRVNVLEAAHPGVKFELGDRVLELKDALTGPVSVVYNVGAEKFEVVTLQAFEKPVENTKGDKHGKKK
ncbi:MAG: FapA family protein [Oligoflexia bacterium]|nr:FapA family protein [Oligoflexia bacterium]